MKTSFRNWISRPVCTVFATGLLALLLSALPILVLYLTDLRLLDVSHARIHTAVSLTPTGDDLYLVRALQEDKTDSVRAWVGEDMEKDALYLQAEASPLSASGGRGLLNRYLSEMAQAGALEQQWMDAISQQIESDTCYYTYDSDTAGFIRVYGYDDYYDSNNGYDSARNFCALTLESRTGRVVNLWLSFPQDQLTQFTLALAPEAESVVSEAIRMEEAQLEGKYEMTTEREPVLPIKDVSEVLNRYIDYLGFAPLGDWAKPEDTDYAQNSLYSQSAQLMVTVASLLYLGNDGMDRWQLSYTIMPVSTDTLASWQDTWRQFNPSGIQH